jgi:hypothetical protein
VGSAAVVADHGGGGSRAVSNYVTKPMASVALGQGRAVVKFAGPTISPEKCGGGTTDQFETSAVWVVERPDDAAALATVSGVSSRAAKPSWWCQGLPPLTDCVLPQFGLKDCRRREVSVVVFKHQDTKEHDRGIATAGMPLQLGPRLEKRMESYLEILLISTLPSKTKTKLRLPKCGEDQRPARSVTSA